LNKSERRYKHGRIRTVVVGGAPGRADILLAAAKGHQRRPGKIHPEPHQETTSNDPRGKRPVGQSREVDNIRMPYGAFKGKPMHQIPSGYLHWVAENFKNEDICAAADEEWQWREKYGEHWEE